MVTERSRCSSEEVCELRFWPGACVELYGGLWVWVLGDFLPTWDCPWSSFSRKLVALWWSMVMDSAARLFAGAASWRWLNHTCDQRTRMGLSRVTTVRQRRVVVSAFWSGVGAVPMQGALGLMWGCGWAPKPHTIPPGLKTELHPSAWQGDWDLSPGRLPGTEGD